MNRINVNNKWRIKEIVFISILTSMLFFSGNEDISISYVNISRINLYLLLIITLGLIMAINNKNIQVNILTFLLFARLFIYIIPLIHTDGFEGFLGNYISVVSTFIIFMFFSNGYRINNKNYLIYIKIFLLAMSCQVIWTSLQIYNEGKMLYYKQFMSIPFGKSNYISCILLPLLVFVFTYDKNKRSKYLTCIVCAIAILATNSKNAMITGLILISGYIIIKIFKLILKMRNATKGAKSIVIIITMVILLFVVYSITNISIYILSKYNMGYQLRDNSFFSILDSISSGRMTIYLTEIRRWLQYPFLGNSLVYKLGYSRSHNWVIELLVQSGIIGAFIYLTAISKWIKTIYKYIKVDSFIRACFFSVITILFQGLFEISVFTSDIDIIMWIFIALSFYNAQVLKKNIKI